MHEINRRKGIVLFLLLFVIPPLLAQPFRQEIIAIVSLPEPTLWQSLAMFGSQIIMFALAAWAWNQRKRIKHLEREVAREKYRDPTRGIEQ